ncbi:hypothetical protein EQU24_11030 [Methylotuvimicrobium buryatense]|uniref:Uncharacterized protein n=1 Tax=Methylotuvimicrobium buryatense TaxID=95641 RepID=A0A4P9UQY3_METBY|nr:hypothetical protein EQU24_11030 [Methylotuvimicrobium buryatense]
MAMLFCSVARRENRRIASYVTVFAKLPLLLTPLTYIHVGNAATGQKSALAYQKMWPREVYSGSSQRLGNKQIILAMKID